MLKVKAFTFNPVQENSYVLYNDKGDCVIIDPGCYSTAEKAELKAFIDDNKLKPIMLLNTHCHLDHVFGNKFVAETWGLTLHIHKLEEKMLEMAPASGKMWQLPFDNYDGDLIFLKENESITIGDDSLNILFTPGHSPGSVCFYNAQDKYVIGGDVLFYCSIGRADLPGGDYETLLNSVRTQLYILPDDVTVYSGHGQKTSIGFEKINNPFVKGG
jgi:hydroxyacylglutathione hydrolase